MLKCVDCDGSKTTWIMDVDVEYELLESYCDWPPSPSNTCLPGQQLDNRLLSLQLLSRPVSTSSRTEQHGTQDEPETIDDEDELD